MNPAEFIYKAFRALVVPQYRFSAMSRLGFYDSMSDEEFISRKYMLAFGRPLDLNNPKLFTEKLQWLKLYNRRPEYTVMVDKYAVKKFVADKIGAEYIIPLLGVYNSFDEIDFDRLPNKFVLKCTHDSGLGLAICRDKSKMDMEEVRSRINRSLKINYFWSQREWPYKNVPPRIIAEEYIQDGNTTNLPVYKIFCFNGVPKLFQVIQDDKTKQETIDYFDTEWNRLELRQNFPNSKTPLPKPVQLEEMLSIASELSKGIPNVRIDLYSANSNIYFSEYTFFSDAGFVGFEPPEWDEILGSWLELPEKYNQ